LLKTIIAAFIEDKDMIEAQQRIIESANSFQI
jgi:hypothetical protein